MSLFLILEIYTCRYSSDNLVNHGLLENIEYVLYLIVSELKTTQCKLGMFT